MSHLANFEIAKTLAAFADLLEIAGENVHRSRAFRRAAETIRSHPESIAALRAENLLTTLPGVGAGIAVALEELVDTGSFTSLDQLAARYPLSLLDVLQIPGLGAKSVRRVFEELQVSDLDRLETAARTGKLATIRGLGPNVTASVLDSIAAIRRRSMLHRLGTVLPLAESVRESIQRQMPEAMVDLAGSVRRMEPLVTGIDLVIGHHDITRAVSAIRDLPDTARTINVEASSIRMLLQSGVELIALMVAPEHYGTELIHATGSAAHLAQLGDLPLANTEHDVYQRLGLPFIPPEVRSGGEELTRARAGDLDRLLTIDDLRGEFHCHSTWSDGSASIATMADAAAVRGYDFLAISDHSHGLGIAGGLDTTRLADQRREIDAVNQSSRLTVLAAAEVEVDRTGNLDFDDNTLSQLDIVVASLHVGLRQPRDQLTNRLISILENSHVDIVAHPSGRLLNQREGGDFDWDRVFAVAAKTGTALEINANPARLDLDPSLARQALDAGCVLSINCDAHRPEDFALMRYGVAMARKAWARPDQIVNCWPYARTSEWVADHRRR